MRKTVVFIAILLQLFIIRPSFAMPVLLWGSMGLLWCERDAMADRRRIPTAAFEWEIFKGKKIFMCAREPKGNTKLKKYYRYANEYEHVRGRKINFRAFFGVETMKSHSRKNLFSFIRLYMFGYDVLLLKTLFCYCKFGDATKWKVIRYKLFFLFINIVYVFGSWHLLYHIRILNVKKNYRFWIFNTYEYNMNFEIIFNQNWVYFLYIHTIQLPVLLKLEGLSNNRTEWTNPHRIQSKCTNTKYFSFNYHGSRNVQKSPSDTNLQTPYDA